MPSLESAFSVKALAPDNDRKIKDLIGLFTRAYGEAHPNRNVYSAQYWRSHIVSRFSSFVCCDGQDFIAHVAALPDPHDPSTIQLVFPAVDPEYKSREEQIVTALEERLKRQAERAGWRSVFYFEFAGAPLSATYSLPILGVSDVSIAPNYFPRIGNGESQLNGHPPRLTILVRQALLNGALSEEQVLHVPPRHLEMVRYLYEPFGMRRTFAPPGGAQGALPADSPALHEDFFGPISVRHIFVQPSLIAGNQKSELFKSDSESRARFVFVNMRDPACPAFCDELEGEGFVFCGIMPRFFSRENIIFCQCDDFTVEADEIIGERAHRLAAYIEAETRRKASALVGSLAKGGELHARAGRR